MPFSVPRKGVNVNTPPVNVSVPAAEVGQVAAAGSIGERIAVGDRGGISAVELQLVGDEKLPGRDIGGAREAEVGRADRHRAGGQVERAAADAQNAHVIGSEVHRAARDVKFDMTLLLLRFATPPEMDAELTVASDATVVVALPLAFSAAKLPLLTLTTALPDMLADGHAGTGQVGRAAGERGGGNRVGVV